MYCILLVCTHVHVLNSFPSVWILVAMLSVESVVRGYIACLYGDWSPSVGDKFELEIEELTCNKHNRYAMSIKVSGDIVGHVSFSKRS